jgi:hypothetical protein
MQIATAALAAFVAANLLVSVLLWRSPIPTRAQQVGQSLIIWLVPVLGFAVVWYFLREGHSAGGSSSGFVDNVSVADGDVLRDHISSDHSSSGDVGSGH